VAVVGHRWENISYEFWELLMSSAMVSYMSQHWNVLYLRMSKNDTTGAAYGKLKRYCDVFL
jgi:hypothetical protein